ncbi:competence protein TfoX [Burkholderia cenocepacia]|uniref:Competence protein TfoX n=1 Tax=Burkholderia cenocepacia TaxID=95486 RepID=A0A1V2VQY3_9BURK|nr:TfoX/Sxy family protein [Burkholderia cenocepacia]MBR8250081.1 TfoX/Sxy family protein [Burkholderia cenocepacia]MBR8496551.1 TfoX/Sxy family protein [Burkholderia cenocepacia]MCA8005825.1 TfoX/Sxy family protein [Burkholderia cenocepacia]MDN7627305.1 TfoX/Sxy family protein [Burkholderia cenocepacia]ONJ04509.1 competence protein TfoX [Burkholderia cenocepacia]
MASSQSTVDFIVEQIAAAGTVSARKMFGEYGIYCDGRMVALVCDDRLFVKPTPEGRAYLGVCDEAPPYPSAKPHLVIAGDRWDDHEWLSTLIRITAAQVPLPVKRSR